MEKTLRIYPFGNFDPKLAEKLKEGALKGNPSGADIITLERPTKAPFLEPVSAIELPGYGTLLRIRTASESFIFPPNIFGTEQRMYLEQSGSLRESFLWAVNSAYWESFLDFEKVKKKGFEQSLPAGDSDGVNPRFWNHFLNKFLTFTAYGLGQNCPQEILASEIGAGSGRQAYALLATLRHVTNLRDRPDIFSKFKYQILDNASEVIEDAKNHTREFSDKISLNIVGSGGYNLGKNVMLFMASNLLDNLPCDQIAYVKDAGFYNIHSRLYINQSDWYPFTTLEPKRTPVKLFAKIMSAKDAKDVIDKNDPGMTEKGVAVWQDFYNKLRLEQSGVPIPADYPIGGEVRLSDLKLGNSEFMIFNVSDSVANLQQKVLDSLHPWGAALFLDIFRRTGQFMDSHSGPTKLDGSVFGWVNLDQVELTAKNNGAVTAVYPFKSYNPKSNGSVVLTGSEHAVRALL